MKKLMKVILLQDIKGLGKRYDVKEVSLGYARNFLLPKKLAETATPQTLKKLIDTKAEIEKNKSQLISVLKKKAEEIKSLILTFKLKTGEREEVFGSVSAKDIQNKLYKRGIPEVKVILEKSIKSLGETMVEVDLGEGVKTKIKVEVEKED